MLLECKSPVGTTTMHVFWNGLKEGYIIHWEKCSFAFEDDKWTEFCDLLNAGASDI